MIKLLSRQVNTIEVLITELSLKLRRCLRDRAFAYMREALGFVSQLGEKRRVLCVLSHINMLSENDLNYEEQQGFLSRRLFIDYAAL